MPTDSDNRSAKTPRLPAGLAFGFGIAMVATLVVATYFLWQTRAMLEDRAANNAETLVKALGQFVYTSLHESELMLQMASDEYIDRLQSGAHTPRSYADYLNSIRQRIPAISSLLASDDSGTIRFGENGPLDNPVSIADRPYYATARDNPGRLAISPPVLGRISQQWVIPIAWRLDGPERRYDGMLVANISADYFKNLFASLKAGPQSTILLFDAGTSISLRYPEPGGPGSAVGLKIGSSQFKFLWAQGIRDATYRAQSTTDGIWRTYSYRQIGDYPLFVMAGVADEDILAPWKTQVLVTIAFMAALAVLLGLLWLLLRRGMAAQQQSSLYARSLIEASLDPLVTINNAGKITDVNAATENATGVKRSQLVGSDFATYFTDPEKARAGYRQVFSRGFVKDYPLAIRHKSGDVIDVLYNASVYRDSEGHVAGIFAAARDITERKRVEVELEHYRLRLEELVQQRTDELMRTEAKASHILQSSADGLYGVDSAGIVTFINPAACQLLGYEADQVVGRSAHELFHHSKPDGSPYPIEECPTHTALRRGHEIRVDNEVYWHADGHAVPVMYAAHPMIIGGSNGGAVISLVDMSEQRAVSLAREEAILAAEHLARVRSEFLANMSHEIRTPINGVLGFAEIGYRNYRNSEKARNAFEKILVSGNRLLGVINDILDFSKIEAGKLHIEQTSVTLRELIEQAVDVVQERADAKHLALRIDIAPDFPRTCSGDPLRIGQVLLNLLTNAVKFTEEGSVSLSASRVDETLCFKVVDTGIGMDEEQLRELFTPFQQGDGSMTRRFGGTGLGLTIAKRIAELMEGDIRVDSRLGVGSTFEFRLPYIEDKVPARTDLPSLAQAAESGANRLSGITILVAEDEPINQQVIELNLAEEGARVVMVNTGKEAVERVVQDGVAAYDIVLMDLQMPEMGGLEATRRLLELAPALPIIGQTAHAMAEEREKCFAAGMVDHIAKPIPPDELVKLVLRHVKVTPPAATNP